MKQTRMCWVLGAMVLGAVVLGAVVPGAVVPGAVVPGAAAAGAQTRAISDKPDTPFKLATFEAGGKTRIGLVLDARVLDIAGASDALTRTGGAAVVRFPGEMRELIENYERLKPRLYQIANHFKTAKGDSAYTFDVSAVSLKAPIKYPWNLLAIAANYRLHAGEMFPPGSPQQK